LNKEKLHAVVNERVRLLTVYGLLITGVIDSHVHI